MKYLKQSQTLVLIITIYQANVVPKVLHQMLSLMSTINPGDYYPSMKLFKFETLEKV